MSAKPPAIRYVHDKASEIVETNDAAVMVVEPSRNGRLLTHGLVGCTAVAGYLLDDSGRAFLGISHTSLGMEGPWPGEGGSLSARFMSLISRQSYRFGNLKTGRILVATMSMREGRRSRFYDNSNIVAETATTATEIRRLGRVEVDMATYDTPDDLYLGHGVSVVRSENSVSIMLATNLEDRFREQVVYHVETPVPHL